MPTLTGILIVLASLGVLIVSMIGFANSQYQKGYKAGLAANATAQVKHKDKVRDTYGKIDKQTPSISNPDAVDDFLLKHTRDDSQQ